MLKKNEVILCIDNGARAVALIVETYHLSLPNRFVLKLNNCYYVPVLTANIISISCLNLKNFSISSKNNSYSFSHNGIFYRNAPMENIIYILNMINPILNRKIRECKTIIRLAFYICSCK